MNSNLFFILSLLLSIQSHAYPEFISYGYTSCLTCHVNSHGNGPLNDYGRALWATEIAAKPFWSDSSNEELGNKSGFLGSTQMPWWIRPSYKYRYFNWQVNPGSSSRTTRAFTMQNDLQLTLYLTPEQTHAFVGSYGFYPADSTGGRGPANPSSVSRDHYIRYQATDSLWIWGGLMDKVFGTRHPNHEAVNRKLLGLGQFDQSYGLLIDYIKEQSEFSFNYFIGNSAKKTDTAEKGFTVNYESDLGKKNRLGFSILSSKNKNEQTKSALAGYGRFGFSLGNSFLLETGLINTKAQNAEGSTAGYGYAQTNLLITRGYGFITSQQYSKTDLKSGVAESFLFSLGLQMYPFQRCEIRLEAAQSRVINDSTNVPDSWQILSQVHISL
jgi:hypothetical protein